MEQKKDKKNLFICIAYFLFPFIEYRNATKKIEKKMKEIGESLPYDSKFSILSEFNSPERVDMQFLEKMISDNQHIMERLEDKAKVQIAGITIAVSIMFGVAGETGDITSKFSCLKWLVFVLLVASVIYMVCSGLHAFRMLTDKNVFYYAPNNISEMEDEDKRKTYNAVIAKNQLQNSIRNNELSTSYAFMRNAIILLIAIFVLWNIPTV